MELIDLAAGRGGIGRGLPALLVGRAGRHEGVEVDGPLGVLDQLGHGGVQPEVLGQGQGRPPLDGPVLAPTGDRAEEIALDEVRQQGQVPAIDADPRLVGVVPGEDLQGPGEGPTAGVAGLIDRAERLVGHPEQGVDGDGVARELLGQGDERRGVILGERPLSA